MKSEEIEKENSGGEKRKEKEKKTREMRKIPHRKIERQTHKKMRKDRKKKKNIISEIQRKKMLGLKTK